MLLVELILCEVRVQLDTAAIRELKEEARLVPIKPLEYKQSSWKVGDIEVQFQLRGQLRN